MKKLNKIISLFFIVLIFINGCSTETTDAQQEYNKCTALCVAIVGEDFVTLELCRQECEEKFLEE